MGDGRWNIAGDLVADELVVGQVGVEGLDDVVAVRPGIGSLGVDLKAMGVGVAHDIEPVLGPAFAMVRRGEQAVNEALQGRFLHRRSAFGDEARHLFRSRRQAGQIEAEPANQRGWIGGWCPMQPLFGELGIDERVDRSAI